MARTRTASIGPRELAQHVRSADSRASRALRTAGRTRTLTDITRRTGQTGAEQHERTELRRGRDRRLLIEDFARWLDWRV